MRGSPPSKTFDNKKAGKHPSSTHTLLSWVLRDKAGVRNVQERSRECLGVKHTRVQMEIAHFQHALNEET